MFDNKQIELTFGNLNVQNILCSLYDNQKILNNGAMITFVGTVRAEDNIEALSFDIYEPILFSWFNDWTIKARKENAALYMAHSIGEVPIHTSSFVAGILSPYRKVAIRLINDFVEDFKSNAPIWKYDIINGKKIYAKIRSNPIKGFGILS